MVLCSVVLGIDLGAQPIVRWLGPGGNPVPSGTNITVGNPVTLGNKTEHTLSFSPLESAHRGEFTCSMSLRVSRLNVTLTKADSILLQVYTSGKQSKQAFVALTNTVRNW